MKFSFVECRMGRNAISFGCFLSLLVIIRNETSKMFFSFYFLFSERNFSHFSFLTEPKEEKIREEKGKKKLPTFLLRRFLYWSRNDGIRYIMVSFLGVFGLVSLCSELGVKVLGNLRYRMCWSSAFEWSEGGKDCASEIWKLEFRKRLRVAWCKWGWI